MEPCHWFIIIFLEPFHGSQSVVRSNLSIPLFRKNSWGQHWWNPCEQFNKLNDFWGESLIYIMKYFPIYNLDQAENGTAEYQQHQSCSGWYTNLGDASHVHSFAAYMAHWLTTSLFRECLGFRNPEKRPWKKNIRWNYIPPNSLMVNYVVTDR